MVESAAAPIDDARLGAWLDERLGDRVPVECRQMKGGASCEVFSVRRGDQHWVLRRAPRSSSAATAHDVLREFQILDAIRDEQVRIARPVAACDDPSIAGAPFYLMDFVDGRPIGQTIPTAYRGSTTNQVRALTSMIDALTEVHLIDWERLGLDVLGKPEGFLRRQVPRWLKQYIGYESRELPAVHEVASWLEDTLPSPQPPALVHGDYKVDNLLYSKDPPARVLAIVDWEMATIGDPLLDLAWALMFHPEEGNPLALGSPGQPKGFEPRGLPSRQALLERYVLKTSRDLHAFRWYRAFAPWKLAIVLEGNYAKHLRGESHNPIHAIFGPVVDKLLDAARAVAEEGNGG